MPLKASRRPACADAVQCTASVVAAGEAQRSMHGDIAVGQHAHARAMIGGADDTLPGAMHLIAHKQSGGAWRSS